MGQPNLEYIRALQELAAFYEGRADYALTYGTMDEHVEFAGRYHEKCDALRSISPNLDPRKAYA